MNSGINEGEKVAFCEQYNMVPCQSSKSTLMMPCPPSNVVSSIVSQASSSNVATVKQNALRKSEPLMLEPPNDQKPANTMTIQTLECEKSEISKNKISEILPKTEAITTDGMSEGVTRIGGCNKPDGKKDISDIVKERDRSLTPDDVVRVIGQRLFRKARKTILHQQKIFSSQIFELHRLIKVQKLIARSQQQLHEKNLDPNKPQIRCPKTDKLLYTTPIDRSPPFTKPKTDPLTPNPENVHLSLKTTPKLLTTSTSTFAPWFFPPPIGNQWLVPIKSPSEGLVYKPYPGPCFQTNGITFGTELGQTYVQNYTTTPMNHACGSNVSVEQASSRLEKDALALFPMAPSSREVIKDESGDRKSGVIKVVPHNRKSAPASAARIFESLKEERDFLRLSTCASHAS